MTTGTVEPCYTISVLFFPPATMFDETTEDEVAAQETEATETAEVKTKGTADAAAGTETAAV